MDNYKINEWLQIAASVGVIFSLIFVGLEIRLSREIAESAAYQARADASMMLRTMPLDSPELLSAIAKIWAGNSDELEPNERTATGLYYLNNMIYLESVHYQYINGFVTEEQWQSNIGDIEWTMSTPVFRSLWEQNFGTWRASFTREVESIIQRLDEIND
jgi:hypothetical protein